ncbi:hypothetical protein B0A69_18070 [Chryseobacterium shigense]|uniref:Type VI secretion system (T6SS), amidase immunity protein n=1 Tax=Chryseobacterium shigense TaxID=297244 RepID=A0A1N7K8M9_9FLAO|nr:hypothetical protein [Chryseobacterium shigense]PQA91162.1 hypothetical protein B0A69_18070 [Chryseobacterium shigense]SIS57910.1 hypothetical protein SAMN05421639_1093 [Chryseobacterium shigense]
MGIKMISTALCVFFSTIITAQTESVILKKYALHKCLSDNYKSADPSFISHDYSASYMFQIKNADYNKLNLLDKHIEETTSDYYKMGITENLEDSKANYIFWHCMDFYESKELNNYIRKLIGVTTKKKTSKK